MNWLDEYEASSAWAALTPEQQEGVLITREIARLVEEFRQKRIAKQYLELFGPNDDKEA